jgi:tRNA1Val (adenine37-N6)-methyltransferase
MPNNYFQFKQFTVYQDMCSMKVCTDACLFGAWVADKVEKGVLQSSKILDIGTGTGLLSLMVAQKSDTAIDAVELEENAFEQAKSNFGKSPWSERFHIINADVKHFNSNHRYDLIISNPPFFEKELRSPKEVVNLARHDSGLDIAELIKVVITHLDMEGRFAVLLPYKRIAEFEEMAKMEGLYVFDKMLVRQTPGHSPFRGLLLLSKNEMPISKGEMTIKNAVGTYTEEFEILLKDYYLNL